MRNGQEGCAVIYTPVISKYTRAGGQAPICLVIGVLKTPHSLEDNNAPYLETCRLDLGFSMDPFVLSLFWKENKAMLCWKDFAQFCTAMLPVVLIMGGQHTVLRIDVQKLYQTSKITLILHLLLCTQIFR